MNIQQLSVFVENKSGRLAEIAQVLAMANIDIRAISVADTSDFGILRVIVDKPDSAVNAMREAGMTVALTDVIAVGINDKPGEFAKVLKILAENKLDVEYMYALSSRNDGKASVIIRVDNSVEAEKLLKNNGITTLTAEDIHNM